MWVKYLPLVAGGGGGKGPPGVDDPPPPPQASSSGRRSPVKKRAASGKNRGRRKPPGIVLKVSPQPGRHPFHVALLPVNEANLARAAEVMRAGGTVAFPTETVYGLGAIAFDPAAVARIFEIKRRPSFDPLIVHVAGRAMLEEVVSGVPPVAEALIEAFWPGPLTLVLAKSLAIGDLVTAGSNKVAVRMPSHWVARALLERVGAPLAAPSANPFGALSPTRAEHVAARLGDRVDLILDGGPAEHGIESTIVALEPWPMLLRPGAIPVEEIEAIAGALDRAPKAAAIVPGASSAALFAGHAVAADRPGTGGAVRPPRRRIACAARHLRGLRYFARALKRWRPARRGGAFLRNAARARRDGRGEDRCGALS